MSTIKEITVTTFVSGMAALFYVIAWIFQNRAVGCMASLAATVGFLGNLAGFGLRWAESYQMGFGRAPLSTLYESLVFFALSIAALYLVTHHLVYLCHIPSCPFNARMAGAKGRDPLDCWMWMPC